MAASKSELGDLHNQLSATLSAELKRLSGAGEAPPASLLKEIREFLKDNGIDATLEPDANPEELLRGAVPFLVK